MDKILPCPFCGKLAAVRMSFQSEDSEDPLAPLAHDDYMAYLCDFLKGGCGATSGYRPTKGQALADWNCRSPQPSAPVQRVNIKDYKDTAIGEIAGIPFVYPSAVGEDKHLRNPASPSAQPQPEEAVEQDGPQSVAERPFDRRTTRIMAIADELDEEGRYNQASSIRSVALERDELATKISAPTAPEPSVAAEAGLPSQMLRDFLSLASEWRRNCEKAGNDAAHVPQRMCAVDVECLVKSYQRRLPAHPGIVPGWVPEDERQIKSMVEAIMYGEAALSAAQTTMTMRGDLKGAGLMQEALDKLRIALPAAPKGKP